MAVGYGDTLSPEINKEDARRTRQVKRNVTSLGEASSSSEGGNSPRPETGEAVECRHRREKWGEMHVVATSIPGTTHVVEYDGASTSEPAALADLTEDNRPTELRRLRRCGPQASEDVAGQMETRKNTQFGRQRKQRGISSMLQHRATEMQRVQRASPQLSPRITSCKNPIRHSPGDLACQTVETSPGMSGGSGNLAGKAHLPSVPIANAPAIQTDVYFAPLWRRLGPSGKRKIRT